MIIKSASLAAITLAIGFFTVPASAAPAGLAGVKDGTASNVEQTATGRRCWRSGGRRHCVSRSYRRDYNDDYGPSYGYRSGPSIGLSVGGSREGRRHRRGHRD